MKTRMAVWLAVLSLGLSHGALASDKGATLVDDALRGVEAVTLTIDDDGPLRALNHDIQIAIPDLGDAPETVALNTSAFVSGVRVKGRMTSVISRVRDGRSKRLGRVKSSFGEPLFFPDSSSAFHTLDIPSDNLQAGDVLLVEVSFAGNSTLSGGDRMDLTVGWDAVYMGEIPFRIAGASTPPRQPADELTAADRRSAWVRAERTLLADKTRLGKVVRELEIRVPDLSGSVEAETLDFVFSSRVLSFTDDGLQDPAMGRLQARIFRFPAAARARQRLARSTAKMTSFNSRGSVSVPVPAGLGLGDRIVVRISYKTDWKVENPNGADAVLTAQMVMSEPE